jgi:hypothetical protein
MFILKLNVEASTPEVAIEIQIAMLLHSFNLNLFSLKQHERKKKCLQLEVHEKSSARR